MKPLSECETNTNLAAAVIADVVLIGASPSLRADPGDSSSKKDASPKKNPPSKKNRSSEKASSSEKEPGWQFYLPSYLWAAGAKGKTSTLPGFPATDIDANFFDSLRSFKDLDGALVATVFARNDRFLLIADLNWMKLSPTQSGAFNGDPIKLKFFSETVTFMGAVGYRLVDNSRFIIDTYVGAKLWYMDNSASVQPAVVMPNKVERKETWVDGVVGGQLRFNLSEHFFVNALSWVGGGGSKLYGDIYAGVGYQINDKWDVFAGYRALHVEHAKDWFLYDMTQYGPLLGVAAKL